MKITMIGTGYVGLVTGTCFAEMGNTVWCIDVDKKKIDDLQKGIIPIYEPGLEEMVKTNMAENRLLVSTDIADGLRDSLFAFIAVGTPPGEDGSADMQYVLRVAADIGRHIEKYTVVVNKSTVPVGTAELVRSAILSELHKRGRSDIAFDVVSNPEFLKEGNAIDDFMIPDRIVVGVDSERSAGLMRELYEPFVRNGHPIHVMDIASSELTKYAANAMLATRISFMNEIARLCEATGADVEMVRTGIGSDKRIGMPFLYAGLGYGGSCFPKDVNAIINTFKEKGIRSRILDAVNLVNREQRGLFVDKIMSHYQNKIQGLHFAVWGLAFKPQTDDMREAPSIDIITALRERGASFAAYDPVAAENTRAILGDDRIRYCDNEYEALHSADALLLLTEWKAFRLPDFDKMKSLMKKPVIFDGRNQYDPDRMNEMGFAYQCFGRPACI